MKGKILLMSWLLLMGGMTAKAQDVREPAVAGQFYPANASALKSQLEQMFTKAGSNEKSRNVRAIVAPHAGYVYSGALAAHSFSQIPRDAGFDQIFLLGPSHRYPLKGASIYTAGNYKTPLGDVALNQQLAEKLVENHKEFSFTPQAHQEEHCLEVQLPFIQYYFQKPQQIVPILLNTKDRKTIRQIAQILKPYFNKNSLFVVSSDFSHYPAYKQACQVDSATAKAIASGKPDKLVQTVQSQAKEGVPNLATSMCGYSGMLTLMHLAEGNAHEIQPLRYMNSGDTRYGKKHRVVGYWSIRIVEKDQQTGSFYLSPEEKEQLLHIARSTLETYIKKGEKPGLHPQQYGAHLKAKAGSFVTLHKNQQLRGCIGNFFSEKPLYQLVQDMAISAATRDRRFKPVQAGELKDITVEISVLTPLKPINSLDEFEMGRHGIYIVKDGRSGTYLPQVANQVNWSKEKFIRHCAHKKAGIPGDEWKNANLYVYEAIVFSEDA